jgi:peptidoglycan/LPS O-acetylase OafA/YrhL
MKVRREIEIDLLRIFAAVIVVFYHYFYRGPLHQLLPMPQQSWIYYLSAYGYLGVNIFFVISGYVIFLTALDSTRSRFIASRISRLWPAYLVCFAITCTSHILLSPTSDTSPLNIIANLTMAPQWFGRTALDGSYWSLEREILFYLFVLALLHFNQLKNVRIFIAGWLLIATVESIHRVWLLELLTMANWGSFFCAGMLLRLIQRGARDRLTYGLLAWSMGVSLYLTWRDAAIKLHIPTPEVSPILMVLAFILFVAIAFGRVQLRPSKWIALGSAYSYPLYLIHHDFGYNLAKIAPFNLLSGATRGVILIVVMLLITIIVHHVFEKRMTTPFKTASLNALIALKRLRIRAA